MCRFAQSPVGSSGFPDAEYLTGPVWTATCRAG